MTVHGKSELNALVLHLKIKKLVQCMCQQDWFSVILPSMTVSEWFNLFLNTCFVSVQVLHIDTQILIEHDHVWMYGCIYLIKFQ